MLSIVYILFGLSMGMLLQRYLLGRSKRTIVPTNLLSQLAAKKTTGQSLKVSVTSEGIFAHKDNCPESVSYAIDLPYLVAETKGHYRMCPQCFKVELESAKREIYDGMPVVAKWLVKTLSVFKKA